MRSAQIAIAFTLPFLALIGTASAEDNFVSERPITTYEYIADDKAEIVERGAASSNLIYLNRCKGGCTISPGREDSRTNTSGIIGGTVNVSEWNKGDAEWEALVACVSAMYDPFDVRITDVDPGSSVEHFEAIVAGTSSELGMSSNIGGVAPFRGCNTINNAITYSFANSTFYRNGIDSICETVAQETAHAFGMDHQYLCSDPMTYLQPCGYKWFNDVDSRCGEYEPSNCSCSATQNSYQTLLSEFGPGDSSGPDMNFVRPLANTNVSSGFVIEVDAKDYYYGVGGGVEAFVNGVSIGIVTSPPYIFDSPAGVEGITQVEVRATDLRGMQGSTTIEINVGDGCTPGSCTDGLVCYQGYCIEDASSGSGFGANCDESSTCNSELCAKDGEGMGTCTETCEIGEGQCPAGFGCLEAGSANVCWAGVDEDPGGCGCNSSDNGKNGLIPLLLLMLGFMIRRRVRT